MTVDEAFRRWRKKSELTQKAVAAELGIAERTIARWEVGAGGPNATQMMRLERKWPGLLELFTKTGKRAS